MLPGTAKEKTAPYGMSSLALAHVGDAVYELLVRTRLAALIRTAGKLHAATVRLVCAPAQAKAAQAVLPGLSEQERAVFMRARNAQPHHIPHGASGAQYALATALEALFGYLYLAGEYARIEAVFNTCWMVSQETGSLPGQG